MTFRMLVVSLALAAIAFASTACGPGSSTEGESSEGGSFWDRTVGNVTDSIGGHAELSEYANEDTGWRTEPSYELRPEDFVVLTYPNEFLALGNASPAWIVYNADAVECEPYRWDADTVSTQLAARPEGMVFGAIERYINDDMDVFYGKGETQYLCRVSSDSMIGFGAPRYLADHVSAAMDSYKRAMTEYERATSTRDDREAQLDRVLARYCFNPPCRVADYDATELSIAYSLVEEADTKAFRDYNEAVYELDEAIQARKQARFDAQCWVGNAWSATHVNHFPKTCGSPTAEGTATAIAAKTATAKPPSPTPTQIPVPPTPTPTALTITGSSPTPTPES